jgi:uncharacterized repeat protein (TIGR01451 family)
MMKRTLFAFTLALTACHSGAPVDVPTAPTPTSPTVETPPQLAAIASATSPDVSLNQTFTLTVDVSNSGGTTATAVSLQPLLQSGAGHVRLSAAANPSSADIAPNKTQRFTVSVEATDPGPVELRFSAAGAMEGTGTTVSADASPLQLTLESPPLLVVSDVTAPPTVDVGQPFEVAVTVMNGGQAAAALVSPSLATGPTATVMGSPVPGVATIAAGQSQTFHVTVSASAEGTLLFTANAAGIDANSQLSVKSGDAQVNAIMAEQPAQLEATLNLPSPATTGQVVTALLIVKNTGTALAKGVTPLAPQVTPGTGGASASTSTPAPAPVDIPGGGLAMFSWTYTMSGAGTFTLSTGAHGVDANTLVAVSASAPAATATVMQPSALVVTAISGPTVINPGQGFDVAVTVKNTGGTTALGVVPDPIAPLLTRGDDAIASTTSSPVAQDLAPGASGTFSFHYTEGASGLGSLAFTSGARGTDSVSHALLEAVEVQSNLTLVRAPPALVVEAVTVPSTLSRGQAFDVQVAVRNTGGSIATAVTPTVTFTAGSLAHATISASPAAMDLDSGVRKVFAVHAVEDGTGTGTLMASAHAAGTNPNFNTPVTSGTKASLAAQVQMPASLSIVTFMLPSTLTHGAKFALGMAIANSGGATAKAVISAPTVPSANATGGAAAVSTRTPASIMVPGNGIAALVWWFKETGSGGGALSFTAGLTGADLNSGAVLSAPAVTSAQAPVDLPLSCNLSQVYYGLDGHELDATRLPNMAQTDRLRMKAYSSLPLDYAQIFGAVPAGISGQQAAFDAPVARWASEQQLSAVSMYTALNAAFAGCTTLTASAAQFATAPTAATAAAQCQAWQQTFWATDPAQAEIDACATFAVSALNDEPTPRAKWAAACASVATSMGFLAE